MRYFGLGRCVYDGIFRWLVYWVMLVLMSSTVYAIQLRVRDDYGRYNSFSKNAILLDIMRDTVRLVGMTACIRILIATDLSIGLLSTLLYGNGIPVELVPQAGSIGVNRHETWRV